MARWISGREFGADGSSDAWAVGADTDFVTSFENVIEHWNGSRWTRAGVR